MTHGRERRETTGRRGSGPLLVLEDSFAHFEDLVTIETKGLRRKAVIETIRTNLAEWMNNPEFTVLRNSPLDLVIVAKVNRRRMSTQDVDNVAKIVLDALKEAPGDVRFLFHKDSQIVRLLVWKIQQQEDPDFNTDTIGISFRVHDPDKQMILERPHVI